MKPFLLPTKIRGLGTADVEGLGSYVHRLAHLHSVSAGQILNMAATRVLGIPPDEAISKLPYGSVGGLAVFSRPNGFTDRLLKVLVPATGDASLRSTTFVSLSHALDRAVGIYSRNIRWCPACMREFEELGDPGYFKLLWTLQPVTHCPTHRVALLDECPVCHAHQNSLGHKGRCTNCWKCGASLSSQPTAEDMEPSWAQTTQDLATLVNAISHDPSLDFPSKGPLNILTSLYESAWENGKEQQLWDAVPRDECLALVHKQQPLTLTHARRLAFRLNIPLLDLLLGDLSGLSHELNPAWFQMPVALEPRPRAKHRDRQKVLKQIRLLLRSEGAQLRPPPLCEVANQSDISVGYMRHQFPALAAEIVATHKAWKAEQLRLNAVSARSAALRLLTNENGEPTGYSKKHAQSITGGDRLGQKCAPCSHF